EVSAITVTVLFWFSPRTAYCTCPLTRAYSVWSRPMPTFVPGCTRVPRWRTRICPAFTRSPPNTFTPRRFACESRPFLELPPAFLCAMSLTLNDVVDADLGIRLPMPLRLLVVLAPAQLEDLHLVAAAVAKHGRSYERAG